MAAVAFFLMLVVLLAWPAILSGGTALYAWRGLSRPWLFLVVATAVLYGLYFLVMQMFEPFTMSVEFSQANAAQPLMPVPRFPLLRPMLKPFVVFTSVALPALVGIGRLFRRVGRK